MNDNWKFSGLPYTSPDVEALQARYDALTQRAKDAQDPEDLLEVVRQRDALQQEVALCQSIATIRAFHDVTDEFYQRELQETLPRLETLDTQSLSMTIADSPYAAAVDEAFGPQLRRLLTLDQRLHTGGKELQARISRLTAQYQQLAASTKYQVQGETLSGGQLRFALTSTHRERRKAAYDAQQQTAVGNGPVMEKLLRELVHARNQLARENGFDSFADYGDLSMQRLAMAGRSWTSSAVRCKSTSPPCTCKCRSSSASGWGWKRCCPMTGRWCSQRATPSPWRQRSCPRPLAGCITP